MTSSDTSEREASAACAACLEPIRPGAVTCPHCGSSQVPHRWQVVSQVLKWIGGIVTTISLVVGVITLSQYYLDWREQRADIAEIVAAADWLIKSESYPQAWQMYARAAAINPSSQLVRDGRFRLSLRWVRHFEADPARLEETLGGISETLYRGLADADARQTATILAHVGYVQVLRQVNRLPVFTDVESLYHQALAADPGNVYANAMYGRWLLLHKPMTRERLRQAAARFEQALAGGSEREFVRRLQLLTLSNFTYGHGDDIERTALTLLLQASSDMLDRGESPPPRDARFHILDGYGRMGKAEHVEALLAALPPATHLQVYQWLLAADDDQRDIMRQQSTYVRARLNEAAGNGERALELYRELLLVDTRDELDTLVDQGIERLTGKLPARALARNYRDDEAPHSNPSQFHLATLEHFDPRIRGENLQQALDYFEQQIKTGAQRLDALQVALPNYIERVREVLREADEIEQMNAYSTGFSRWHHDNVRASWIGLMRLQARLLGADGQHEAALARLLDASQKINRLDRAWQPQQALLEYEIAELYARLAVRSGSEDDREQAVLNLQSALARGLVESKQVSWRDIKGEAFAVLRGDERYQNLIRGR